MGSGVQYGCSIPQTLQPPARPVEWSRADQLLSLRPLLPACVGELGVDAGQSLRAARPSLNGEPVLRNPRLDEAMPPQCTCGAAPQACPHLGSRIMEGMAHVPGSLLTPGIGARHLRSPTRGI